MRIAKAAIILMLGNVLSRVLGMGRETVIAGLFGRGPEVDAFTFSAQVQTIVYDLLISGMITAALVPMLSDFAAEERRSELWDVVNVILSLAMVVLGAAVLVLEPLAPLVVSLAGGLSPETQVLATSLLRLLLPNLLILGISAVLTATLYALQRFTYPALGATAINACVILSALALSPRLGISSLIVGTLAGSAAMVLIQLPGLRGWRFRFTLRFSHPALRKILALYTPVLLGLMVTSTGLFLDRVLASQAGEGSISAMRYATSLNQFAIGLVAAAISLAVLPSLSRFAEAGDHHNYTRTLTAGMRMIAVLILPATAGLLALAAPIVRLVYERGAFTVDDRWITVLALVLYLPGLPFAAIDQLLIFAFYARKDTVRPVLVGVAAVGVYLVVALTLLAPLGMAGLVLANSAQLAFHGIIMVVLARRALGTLRGHGLARCLGGALFASALLAAAAYGVAGLLEGWAGVRGPVGELVQLAAAGGAGTAVYVGVLLALRAPEIRLFTDLLRDRLRPTPPSLSRTA